MDPCEHLHEFFQISRLPIHYAGQAGEVRLGEWFTFLSLFPGVEEMLRQSTQTAVYTVSPNHAAFALVHLPDGEGCLFLGPALPFDPSWEVIMEMVSYGGGDAELAAAVQTCLHQIPKHDLTDLLAVARYLCRTVFDFSPPDFAYLDYPPPYREAERFLSKRPDVEMDEAFPKDQLYFFQSLSHAISHGQVDRVKVLIEQMFQQSPVHLPIQVQTVRDSFLLSLSMAATAAHQGGYSLESCRLLMNEYLLQLNHTRSHRQIVRLMNTMLTDFAIRVHQCQIITTSDPVSIKICRNIEDHLYERLTPTTISEQLGYSLSYLCNRFRSATGLTVNDYIHRRKIEEAKALLDQDQANVTDVAMKLGYSTASYFCTVFKKETGITPAQYLRSHQSTV